MPEGLSNHLRAAAPGLRTSLLASGRVGRRTGRGRRGRCRRGRRRALRCLLGQIVGDRGRDAVAVEGDVDQVGQATSESALTA
jgi:hypothetical protein